MADFTPPQDYSSPFANIPSPTAAFAQGAQAGFQTQQNLLQQQIQRYQFGRMQQMQQAAITVAQNPTPENISQLSIAFPEMSEQFKRSYDMLQPQQQRADLQHMSGVYAAVQNGRPDIAAQLLRDRAAALKNSGAQPALVDAANAMADWAEQHPDTFKTSAGVMLASIMGPDKFADAFKGITEAQTGQETMPAKVAEAAATASGKITEAQLAPQKIGTDIQNVQSQITQRAGQLQLDRDKLMSETQTKLREIQLQWGTPSPETASAINTSATDAAAGEQSANRLLDLANRFESTGRTVLGGNIGAVGGALEAAKQIFGTGNAVTALNQEYARLTNNQALASIKTALGGRVTDTDMKTAMGSVPPANASIETVTSYLRGVAKIQLVDAATQQAKAEWLAQTGRNAHLGPAPKDLVIMGTRVPQGTTFADFSRELITRKADEIAAQSALLRAAQRPYMRFATPGGGAPAGQPAGGPVIQAPGGN